MESWIERPIGILCEANNNNINKETGIDRACPVSRFVVNIDGSEGEYDRVLCETRIGTGA